jgi:hypothetical protein
MNIVCETIIFSDGQTLITGWEIKNVNSPRYQWLRCISCAADKIVASVSAFPRTDWLISLFQPHTIAIRMHIPLEGKHYFIKTGFLRNCWLHRKYITDK